MASRKCKDPVCKTMVDTAKIKAQHRNKQYCFCSKGCRASFRRDPQKYTR